MIVDPEEEKKYNHIDSIAASKIFDIEDPMFEELVAEFLKCHIPPCHAGVCHTSWDVGSDCPSEFVIPPDSSPVVPLVHGNAAGVQAAPLHGMPPTNGAAPANGGAPVNGATETRELHPKPQPPPAPKPQENTPPN